jgi:hypothetical protein
MLGVILALEAAMHDDFEHKGHFVHLEVNERGGRWNWWYSIDTDGVRSCHDRPLPSAELAMSEARRTAIDEIDRLGSARR